MTDIAEQEVIDIGDMDVETFNEFATQQGWSDGMPLFVPTEAKVAKFVDTVRGDNRPYSPVPPRQIADPTGAGDAFHGAFAAGLCFGLALDAALDLAAHAAALNCGALGGMGRLMTRGELREHLSARA